MHLLDTTQADMEEVLLALGRHLPVGFELGRPLFATAGGEIVCTDGAGTVMFGLDDGGCRAWRMAELVRGLVEVVEYEYGEETSRRIVRRPGGGRGGGSGPDDGPQPYAGPPGGPDDPEFAVSPVHNRAC